MQAEQNELNHLKNGEVFLPPQVFLDARSHRCHHIVKVHDSVYQGVARRVETLNGN